MKNYVNEGVEVELTAPTGGVTTGLGVQVGSLVVVSTVTAVATAKFIGLAIGVIDVLKVSAQAWTEGLKIYWDDTAKLFTSTASTNPLVGVAAKAAANPSATGRVRLDGVAR